MLLTNYENEHIHINRFIVNQENGRKTAHIFSSGNKGVIFYDINSVNANLNSAVEIKGS